MIAAIVLLRVRRDGEDGHMDFVGRDCETVDEALGQLRDVLVTPEAEGWMVASIVPDTTVAELAQSYTPPLI